MEEEAETPVVCFHLAHFCQTTSDTQLRVPYLITKRGTRKESSLYSKTNNPTAAPLSPPSANPYTATMTSSNNATPLSGRGTVAQEYVVPESSSRQSTSSSSSSSASSTFSVKSYETARTNSIITSQSGTPTRNLQHVTNLYASGQVYGPSNPGGGRRGAISGPSTGYCQGKL